MDNILLVEDDVNFGSVLKSYLELNDFHVRLVTDGQQAINQLKTDSFIICIFDVMLPKVDGFSVAAELKKLQPSTPFIFLTARALKEDMILGYKIGADDYITKPFDSELLIMKIKAILKRNLQVADTNKEYIIGRIIFNIDSRSLTCEEGTFHLSPKESDLLQLLCENTDRVVSRSLCLKKIWGDDNYFTTRSMDVYLAKLRKYLKSDPNVEIQNIHGAGFVLKIKSPL